MAVVFGKGRWIYWTILLAVLVAVGVILVKRQSPEEIARKRLVWGDAAMASGDYEQAIAFYTTAIGKDSSLVSAYFNLALAYEYVDEERALGAWDEYIAVAEGEPSQEEWLGEARAHRGRLKAAPHLARAAELRGAKDFEAAGKEYTAALEWTPEDLEVLRAAAANEAEAGDYEAAIAHYERALEIAPYSMNIRYELAQTYENLDKNKAAALYRELLVLSQTNSGIKMEKLKGAQRRHAALRREGYRDE